jgi:hypothetical protein
MSAHRSVPSPLVPAHRGRPREHRRTRRVFSAAVLAVVTGTGFLVAAGPASAANTWNVAPGAPVNNTCGALATPCGSLAALLTRAVNPVVAGDTINVQAGTYTDRPTITKAVTINGAGSVTYNGSAAGAVFAVNVGAANTLTLNNLTLTNGKAANGGALAVTTGKVVASGVNLTNSVATNAGGGALVPAAANGSLTMTGGTVSGNTATAGGGAIYTVGGPVSLTGTTVNGNSSANAGGVYVATGTTTLTNTTFTGNTSTGLGGAVASAGVVNVSGGTFAGNSAPSGGGLYNNTGTLTVTNATLTNNASSNQGGAVFQQAGTTNLNGSVVSGNTATALGGGVAIVGGALNTTGGSISGNTAANGGGLYNGGTTVIDGTTLDDNAGSGTAAANTGNAGAIYNALNLTVKNASLSGNKVTASTNANPGISGYGGAVFSANLANNLSPVLDFTDTAIDGGGVSGGNAVFGGAIAVYQNTFAAGSTTKITGNGLTLSGNVAQAAGGIYSYGSVTLNDSTLDQNKATHASAGYGGALYLGAIAGTSPTVVLDDTDVTANTAAVAGGGAILGAGLTTTIRNGSRVNANTAPTGGALYNASALTVRNSHVDNNTASVNGGGLYTLTPATVSDSTINDNSAAFLGGGLVAGAQVTVTGGAISGNDAYGAGGVLVSDNVVASIDGTTLAGNTSTGANFGGGAILSGGRLTVANATLTGNQADGASGSGGAIYSGSSNDNVTTSLTVDNSLLADNDAFAGAAVVAGSNGTGSTNKTSITSSTITGNTSTSAVGALEFFHPATVTGSTIADNTAAANGSGGLYAAAGGVSLSGSILSGNAPHQCVATVTDGGYNLISPTDSTCGLSAARNDVFAAAQLGALADNGGPTQTRLPGPASPTLDRIAAGTATGVTDAVSGVAITLCAAGATDQRGTARPQGAKCDIGAVEADQLAPTVAGPSGADVNVGAAVAPLTYTTTGSPQPTLSATGLPSGLSFTDDGDGTGRITGTPAAHTGGSYSVTVKATNEAGNATKTVTIVVHEAPVLNGPSGATYTVGQPGGPTLFAQTSGFPVATLSSSGALPGGVGFTDNGDGTGAYAGTPSADSGGVYPLTVKASNGTPPDATAPFTLTVDEAAGLSGPGTAGFQVGTAGQSGEFTATGFPVPTISASGLPAGLGVVSTGSGKARISGTAANGTGGVYPVTMTAANGVAADATTPVSVTVDEAPEITGPTTARFVAGSANAIGFSSDGYPQATLTITGTLPSGLTFTDNGNGSATIAGTAPVSAIGSFLITVRASNGIAPDATRQVTVEVVPTLAVGTTSLPNAGYKTAYSASLTAVGGQPAYQWSVASGSLPAGLTFGSTGVITGSTTAAPGTYTFTVRVQDSADPAQQDTRQLSITVVKGATTLVVDPVVIQASGLNIKLGIVSATLTGGFPPQGVAGQTIVFKSGATTVCTGVTDADGRVARCEVNLLNTLVILTNGTVTATYAGNATWSPSSGSAGLIG